MFRVPIKIIAEFTKRTEKDWRTCCDRCGGHCDRCGDHIEPNEGYKIMLYADLAIWKPKIHSYFYMCNSCVKELKTSRNIDDGMINIDNFL